MTQLSAGSGVEAEAEVEVEAEAETLSESFLNAEAEAEAKMIQQEEHMLEAQEKIQEREKQKFIEIVNSQDIEMFAEAEK